MHNFSSYGDGAFPGILTAMGDESSASWTNWGMRVMSSEPRVAWPNQSTYSSEASVSYPYRSLYGALSSARDGIIAINEGLVIVDDARTQRALAFAKLVQGLSHGYLAMFWDQANILNEDTNRAGSSNVHDG